MLVISNREVILEIINIHVISLYVAIQHTVIPITISDWSLFIRFSNECETKDIARKMCSLDNLWQQLRVALETVGIIQSCLPKPCSPLAQCNAPWESTCRASHLSEVFCFLLIFKMYLYMTQNSGIIIYCYNFHYRNKPDKLVTKFPYGWCCSLNSSPSFLEQLRRQCQYFI